MSWIDDNEVDMVGATMRHEHVRLRILWSDVLRQACEDFWYGRKVGWGWEPPKVMSENARNYMDALHWLASDDKSPRTFLWVCDHLELDPEFIRREVKRAAAWRIARAQEASQRARRARKGKADEKYISFREGIGTDVFSVNSLAERIGVTPKDARNAVTHWAKSDPHMERLSKAKDDTGRYVYHYRFKDVVNV